MLDNLYTDIGNKIKKLAKWIFIVETIGAIITGFVFLGNSNEGSGLIILLAGPILAWISSWALYAFGQLVDDVNALRNQNAPQQEAAPKATPFENAPQKAVSEVNAQYQSGNCQLCGQASDQLVRCKITDDLGTRYRTICKDCIVKHGATPEK